MSFIRKFDPPGARDRLREQIADYDRAIRGDDLNEDAQRSIRTLAQVFDMEFEGLSPATLWTRLRPLVADPAVQGETALIDISYNIDGVYID